MQFTTLLILLLAANTSYADFPRLASLLARDSFLPRQLLLLGDRLVYSNGIILLSVLAAILTIIFQGEVNAIIPLYAVGVFTFFTLSQAGMVRH
ncbi:amino acid permease [Komarekiella delphini-convector]|uniref:amino acid permease n=1 Tax=Komarekiella delphini-convector TaxID=3050158 RepID=UPI001CD8A217|nr:amino acid permease [Komarekiella delphini-convector]